jgi:hypothetical protein
LNTVSASADRSPTDVGADPSLKVAIPSGNQIDVGTSPLLPTAYYRIIDPSRNARPQDGDTGDRVASTRPGSEPQLPKEESASNAPSIQSHPATTIEGLGVDDPASEEVVVNGTGHSDEHDLPPGELHLAIDMALPNISVQVEPIDILAVSDNSLPQEQSAQGHVIIHMEPPNEAGKSD